MPSILRETGAGAPFSRTTVQAKESSDMRGEESDDTLNPGLKAMKLQQASIDRLYFHKGEPSHSSKRPCSCEGGLRRHDRPEHTVFKVRHMSNGAISNKLIGRLAGARNSSDHDML